MIEKLKEHLKYLESELKYLDKIEEYGSLGREEFFQKGVLLGKQEMIKEFITFLES